MSKVHFEQASSKRNRYWAYIDRKQRKGATSEYRKRVRYVGSIEQHAGMWFWFMSDDSDAGFSSSLEKAKQAIEDRV